MVSFRRNLLCISALLTYLIITALPIFVLADTKDTGEGYVPEYNEPHSPTMPPPIYPKSRQELYEEWRTKSNNKWLPSKVDELESESSENHRKLYERWISKNSIKHPLGIDRPDHDPTRGEDPSFDKRLLSGPNEPPGHISSRESISNNTELKATVDHLLTILHDDDDLKSMGAHKALVKLGPSIVPFLLEVACERSNRNHINSILVEPTLRETTYDLLYHKLIFESESLCWSDADLLISLSHEKGNRNGILTKLYALPDRIIKVKVLRDLADYGQENFQSRDLLLNAFISKDECLYQNAERILRQVGQPAIDDLLSMIKTGDISVKCRAAGVMGGMGPVAAPAVPALIEIYETSECQVRSVILRSLGEIGTPRELIISRLIKSLNEKDPGVRETAIDGLFLLQNRIKEALPKLRSIMVHDPDELVRGSAKAYVSGSEKEDLSVVSHKAIYLFFIISLGMVAYLFVKQKNLTSMAHLYLVAACFGHPLYSLAACYTAVRFGLGESGGSVQNGSINVIGYVTILFCFFLFRFWYFLYISWFRSHLSITLLIKYALDPYVRAHKYCAWVLPFSLLIPLAMVNGDVQLLIIFLPPVLILFIISFIFGFFQSIFTFGSADPSEWDSLKVIEPTGTFDEISGESSENNRIALKWATIKEKVVIHLVTLTVSIGISFMIATPLFVEREITPRAVIEAKQLLQRQIPGTASYFVQKGDNYTRGEHLDRSLPGGRKERYNLAIGEYSKALAIDPKCLRAYEGRASVYMLTEEYQKAIDDLDQMEILNQGLSNHLYERRGLSYKNLGLDEKMCEDYKKACCWEDCPRYDGAVKDGLCKKLSK